MIFSHRAGLAAIGLLALFRQAHPPQRRRLRRQRAGNDWPGPRITGSWGAWSGRKLPEGKPLRLDFDAGRFSADTGCNRAGGISGQGPDDPGSATAGRLRKHT